MTPQTLSPARAESGASLLEVLIAIVVMSFGMLALGGLTATTIQYGKMAQFQTVGVQLASDYADRMRANREGFVASAYNKTSVYSSSTAVVTVPTCLVGCSAQAIQAIDQAEWTNALRRSLPGGDAYVLRDPSSALGVDIWIMWIDPGLSVGSDNSLVTSGSAACPAAAIVGVGTVPHCLYFRASI